MGRNPFGYALRKLIRGAQCDRAQTVGGDFVCMRSNACAQKGTPHKEVPRIGRGWKKEFFANSFVFFLTTQGCVWREERGFPPFLFPRIVIIPQKKHCQDRRHKKSGVWEAISVKFARGLSMSTRHFCMCVFVRVAPYSKDLSFGCGVVRTTRTHTKVYCVTEKSFFCGYCRCCRAHINTTLSFFFDSLTV